MEWQRASDPTDGLRSKAAGGQAGWYWLYRPKSLGRNRYDLEHGMLCLVFVSGGGGIVSPLADLRDLDDASLVCHDHESGRRVDTWCAGPVAPGAMSGAVRARVVDDEVTAQVTGEEPTVPGWSWCRTNAEAPLLLVDEEGIGPVFLERDADAIVRVFLATDEQGRSIDVGEFGFSEPLVSRGGVIDDSGELGRTEAEFFGAIPAHPELPGHFVELP